MPRTRAARPRALIRGWRRERGGGARAARIIGLIVVVLGLAYLAATVVSPGTPQHKQTYSDFLTELSAGQVQSVDVRTKNNTIAVKLRDGRSYDRGFLPDSSDRLENRLESAKAEGKLAEFDVEGTKSSGWLSLLT